MCDRHTAKCEIGLHHPIPPLAGYPGESGDEVDGVPEQESRWEEKVLFMPIRVEYYEKLRKLEREENETQARSNSSKPATRCEEVQTLKITAPKRA